MTLRIDKSGYITYLLMEDHTVHPPMTLKCELSEWQVRAFIRLLVASVPTKSFAASMDDR